MPTDSRSMKLPALLLAFTGRPAAWGRRLGGADAELVAATMTQHNADQGGAR
jgi:hypothetical protein